MGSAKNQRKQNSRKKRGRPVAVRPAAERKALKRLITRGGAPTYVRTGQLKKTSVLGLTLTGEEGVPFSSELTAFLEKTEILQKVRVVAASPDHRESACAQVMLPEVLNKEEETTLVDIAARTLAPFLGREGSDLVLCQNNANDSPWVNFYTRAGRLEIHPDFKKSEFFSEPEKVFTVLFALRTSGECLDFWRGSSPEEMKKRKPDLRISLKSGTFVAFRGNVYHCPQAAKREGRMTCTFAFVCAEQADRYAKYGVEAK